MRKPRPYVFVLWGAGFEEVPATMLVVELRRAGLRVKVVGLNMQGLTGSHGLSLVPDITLDHALALADRAHCVIVPCAWEHLRTFRHDPRIGEFLHAAHAHHARFVVGQKPDRRATEPSAFDAPSQAAHELPEADALLPFIHTLARTLKPANNPPG